MRPSRSNHIVLLGVNIAAATLLAGFAAAQEIKLNVTYVCSGERMYVESCNIRDVSDTSTCMVGHPDRPQRNGLMAYTTETRGTLKKLFPTCQQPTAKETAAADAFQKKQQALYDANVQKANPQPVTSTVPAAASPTAAAANVRPPRTPEERAIRRCVSSGRLAATCTGNQLLGAFSQMVSQVLPQAAKEPAPGPQISGAFEGPGNWRIDFTDAGVLVNCAMLAPDEHHYTFQFTNNRAAIVIDTTPKPLILTLSPDGKTFTGPGPVTIDGVVVSGYDSGLRDQAGNPVANPAFAVGPLYDINGQRVSRNSAAANGHATFAAKRTTCPAQNLSSKGAAVPVQQMQTDLLKSIFNDGDKGPPTPPGIRMRGIFASAATGFSAQFFPESVILGCGPDSARAYPYTVVADGTRSFIKIDAPDHPLNLAFKPDGSLDPGSAGPYQVHGRIVTGQNDNGDFTFAPMEQTCNLAVLTPSKEIPSGGGIAATPAPTAGATSGAGVLSTPEAPLGNATLSIVSGLPGAPNPLAGHPYILLRASYGDALRQGGVAVPAGISPYKYAGTACANRTPDCPKINDSIKASAISAVRADANGRGIFPGVPPGTYYLMISARYNNQSLVWGQAVQLKAGSNSLTLDRSNAIPID
jgi:hypothetical protein